MATAVLLFVLASVGNHASTAPAASLALQRVWSDDTKG
jgi:hypothetical protein